MMDYKYEALVDMIADLTYKQVKLEDWDFSNELTTSLLVLREDYPDDALMVANCVTKALCTVGHLDAEDVVMMFEKCKKAE